LWVTTVVHAAGSSAYVFTGLLAYVVSRENSTFPVSVVRNCVVFRVLSLALVALAAKSCKGQRLKGQKVLVQLPKLLFAKCVDCAASFLVWLAFLPVLADYDAISSTAVVATLSLLVALNLVVDVLGGAAATLALRRLCTSLPEIAADEVDEEIAMSLFDDDDGILEWEPDDDPAANEHGSLV
ncbi:MAG: hypothetical protein AAF368_09245, partial [Planctomycetota bacterium]